MYFLEGTDSATVNARSAKAFGGEHFGHYELFRRLGMGGMAEVFLASPAPHSANRPVALKRMLPHFAQDGTFISRFRREVMLSLQLHHPAIAQVLEVGRVGRTWFMAMELVAGETLERIFDEERAHERRMPASIVRRVGADIAMALDYAHKLVTPGGRPMQIIHRDVSPQNVMISYEGQVKLIDFGVARWADRDPRTGSLAGKVGYFSPEQAGPEPCAEVVTDIPFPTMRADCSSEATEIARSRRHSNRASRRARWRSDIMMSTAARRA